jgi:inorganic phosphate transporter, PiT family
MTDLALNSPVGGAAPADPALRPNLDKGFNPAAVCLSASLYVLFPNLF